MESDAKRLIRCAYGGDADGLRALLEEGCDANAKDSVGWFGLYQACCGGDDDDHISCARVLLDRGAAVDLVTPAGETSLMAAAFRGHARVARLLVSRGADVGVKATDGAWRGKTAAECARDGRKHKIIIQESDLKAVLAALDAPREVEAALPPKAPTPPPQPAKPQPAKPQPAKAKPAPPQPPAKKTAAPAASAPPVVTPPPPAAVVTPPPPPAAGDPFDGAAAAGEAAARSALDRGVDVAEAATLAGRAAALAGRGSGLSIADAAAASQRASQAVLREARGD